MYFRFRTSDFAWVISNLKFFHKFGFCKVENVNNVKLLNFLENPLSDNEKTTLTPFFPGDIFRTFLMGTN